MKIAITSLLTLALGSTAAFSAQIASYGEGASWDLERYSVTNTQYPQMFYNTKVVGMAVAKSNGRYYTWLKNGKVFSGNKTNMTAYRQPYSYSVATGRTYNDILGIAIHPTNDRVYTWYRNGTYSIGRSNDLDRYNKNLPFTLPAGKSYTDVIDMGIAGSSGKVYTWFKDGTVSTGKTNDLDYYQAPYDYTPDYPGGCHDKFLQGVGIRNYGSSDRVISLHSYWVC